MLRILEAEAFQAKAVVSEFWKQWKQPWTQAQCERRYIEGPKIGLPELAVLSGRGQRTLERWCSKDSWVDRRAVHGGELAEQTRQKTITETSDRLSHEISEMQAKHFRDYRIFRQLLMQKVNYLVQKCNAEQHPERLEA